MELYGQQITGTLQAILRGVFMAQYMTHHKSFDAVRDL